MNKPPTATLFDVEPPIETGAEFSACRKYRWALWRTWDESQSPCVFIGLNPSTADETIDDPTIRRCIRFARDWGHGSLFMLNAFGYRATDPRDMKAATDPVGDGNNLAIMGTTRVAVDEGGGIVIAAWGSHCDEDRESRICKLIDRPIYCLGKTKAGRPKHPLYLRADSKPELFWSPS